MHTHVRLQYICSISAVSTSCVLDRPGGPGVFFDPNMSLAIIPDPTTSCKV